MTCMEDLPMRRTRIYPAALLAICVGASGMALAGDPEQRIPDFLPSDIADLDPLWISARQAAPAGALRRELFSDEALWNLDALATENEPLAPTHLKSLMVGDKRLDDLPCTNVQISVNSSPYPVDFDQLLERAEFAFEGRIVAREGGFSYGRLASMLQVEVTELLKAPEWAGSPKTILVLTPLARVLLGDHLACNYIAHRQDVPAVGARIFVFTEFVELRDPLIVGAGDDGLYFETSNGSFSMPSSAPMRAPGDWRFLQQLVYAKVRKPGLSVEDDR